MSVISQVSSSVAVTSSPVVSEAVAELSKIVDKKVEEVALPQILEKKEVAFEAHRARAWTTLSTNLTKAKEVLAGLSLGWNVSAQLTRAAGLVILGSTEAEQKTKVESAKTEEELLERLQHIKDRTIPGLAKLIPSDISFEPLTKCLTDKLRPMMYTLLQECETILMERQDRRI